MEFNVAIPSVDLRSVGEAMQSFLFPVIDSFVESELSQKELKFEFRFCFWLQEDEDIETSLDSDQIPLLSFISLDLSVKLFLQIKDEEFSAFDDFKFLM